ncbi:MAG TPA: response regulator transcription factor [Ignavibacteriaceae bacterium]|nr:response regulator transcription factor [Ignavibacteriaceae bacterium]
MKKIRLLVIEDNRLLREGLTAMLKEQKDMKVADSIGTSENILQKISALKPNIALLDLGLRTQNSLQVVKSVTKNYSSTKIIVMDLVPVHEDILEFVQNGVSGFILKDATVDDFLHTIRSVAEGNKVLPPNLTDSLFAQIVEYAIKGPKKSLLLKSVIMTKREKQVIELIADGLTNKEIAEQLHLSPYTIKSHVHNILEKLALHTRVQIARFAHTSEDFDKAAGSISLIED